jgi:MFS transporter, ACS family, glucarate transporter
MSRHELDDLDAPFATDPVAVGPATRVRFLVLAAACLLAVVTYILRVGFATASTRLEATLGLDESHVGWVMAAFMVAYGVFEVPWGLATDRLGVRNILVLIALGGSLTTAAVVLVRFLPVATLWPFALLLLLRALFGMFQAGTFPSISRMMADWMPTAERGSAQGMIWTSSRLGGALAAPVIRRLIRRFGTWSVALAVAAGLGVLWCIGFWPWFRNRPEQSRWVNAAEVKRIGAGRSGKPAPAHGHIPWRKMLGSANVWALCGMYGFLGYSGNFYLTLLPTYLAKYRHLGDVTMDWLTSLPFACGIAACLLGGVLSDVIIRRTGNRRWGRRAVGVCGLVLGACAILATTWVPDTRALGLLLCLAFAGNDLSMGPAWAAAADIGERYTGTLSGAMNMMASFMAALAAIATGYLFKGGYLVLPFVIFATSYVLGALCWLCIDVTRPLAEDG